MGIVSHVLPHQLLFKYGCWDDALFVDDHVNVGVLVACILIVF